ncbi:hypothetical protein E2C11_07425 [Streptomyces lavendulae]|nr:hypothetical protein [Streptomyces lavendulae]TXJ83297.1 hypothetical protein E2C11_07425 [Streptomyces lavendulae]
MSINNLPTGDDKPGTRRNRGFIASAVFLGLVVVLAIAVIATRGSDKSDAPAASGPGASTGAAVTPSSPAAATGNACGLTDTNQTPPTSTPKDVTWQLVKGDAMPTSKSAGPGKVDGPVAHCYAHTPLGALIAVSQIGDRLGVASNADAIQILKAQAVPGPGVETGLKALAGPEIGDGKADGQLAGFQFASYTPDTAVINLVSHMDNGSYNVATFTMKWLDGDWKIQLQDTGADSSNVSQVTSTAGYVPWSGVS